jgi:hypothetical protein
MSKLPFSIENIAPHLFPEKKKKMIQAWEDKIKEQTGAGKKGNRTNKNLDPKEFESEHWKCFSAAQAATGQYTGQFPYPLHNYHLKVENDYEIIINGFISI